MILTNRQPAKRTPVARSIVPAFALLALLGVSGCGKQAPVSAAHAAGGEVLPGTISDAMLDPERSQERAPLQPVKASKPTVDDFVPDKASEAADVAEAPVAATAAKPAAN